MSRKIKPRTTSKKTISLLNKYISSSNSEMNNILIMMEKLLHWAAIIESSDDAIISKSADGYITSWNKGAQALYGYTPDEIIGQPVSILMPPEKKDDFPYIMNQLHQGNKIEHYETQRMTKSGKILHVSITVSPIRNAQGTIIGASKIARDITEKVEQEKRRDDFVSTASHELKTPITSQKIFGELLEKMIDENGYDSLKPYIRKINQQTNKMSKLVEDLLELSRVQMDSLKMDIEEFDFDNLLDEIIDNARLTTKHTIIKKGNTRKKIKGDIERISQVMMNLLNNGIKYSSESEPIIIKTKVNDEAIIFSIQDFGIGIDKEYHSKIFERFFRVTDGNEKTYPGMGIGLFLSQAIIKRHNGKIWLESEKAKGSTFYFSLPIN